MITIHRSDQNIVESVTFPNDSVEFQKTKNHEFSNTINSMNIPED